MRGSHNLDRAIEDKMLRRQIRLKVAHGAKADDTLSNAAQTFLGKLVAFFRWHFIYRWFDNNFCARITIGIAFLPSGYGDVDNDSESKWRGSY